MNISRFLRNLAFHTLLVSATVLSGCSKTVPDVVGQTQDAAVASIIGAGLAIGPVTQEYSATVAPGTVIFQTPAGGASMASGSAVALTVSQGLQPVTVPNMVGMTQAAATAVVAGAGLALGTVTQAYDTVVASGRIIGQSPVAGTQLSPGAAIALIVSQGPPRVVVPDVVGETQNEAFVAITGAGLTVGTVTQAYSETVPLGNVISQNPVAGAGAAPGTAMQLTVSEGPPPVIVPNVVNIPHTTASAVITNADLVVGLMTLTYSDTVAPGYVISQSPTVGSSVPPGTLVAMTVSIGPQPVTVPDVVGLAQEAASATITDAGLTVGTVTQEHSATVASGSVISQNPAAGTSANLGSAVALTVSEGPQPVPVPNVVGQTQAAASAAITGAGLIVGTITQAYSATAPIGSVISQDPAAGTSAMPDSAVLLTVSKGPQPVTVPSLVGQTLNAALAEINGAGLAVGTLTLIDSLTVASGTVISQSPDAGASVNPGSSVALIISAGLPFITVPDVAGMTQSAASEAVTDAGFMIGLITRPCSNTVPAGSVINQIPAADTQARLGSAVALLVSAGACNPPVEMLQVPAETFTMGRTDGGDDAIYGAANEVPRHPVTLDAYQIGKYPVTNQEYCDVLNWAQARGYLNTAAGTAWDGADDIYAGGNAQRILSFLFSGYCNIEYRYGMFLPITRAGLPDATHYSMDSHPVVEVTWYGAAAFCNWLSQMRGLTPCYDMASAGWPLTVAPPTPGGFRLPTEAEWERAAAWDGAKHWIYGFTGDTLTEKNQANFLDSASNCVNPLGLTTHPYTSTVGWFNGINISPNGNVTTANSMSPVGAYDMSGNVWEWCGDWYGDYSADAQTNPAGPASGSYKVLRGGCWIIEFNYCRTAFRNYDIPVRTDFNFGFRVARTP